MSRSPTTSIEAAGPGVDYFFYFPIIIYSIIKGQNVSLDTAVASSSQLVAASAPQYGNAFISLSKSINSK